MKRMTVVLLVLVSFAAFAQEENLIGDKIESGGFGAPVWRTTRLCGETAFLAGGRGGWIINHTYVIGGGGYSTVGDVKTGKTGDLGKPLYLRTEYSGLELEYIRHSDKVLHWTVHALFGGGSIQVREHEPDIQISSDRIVVLQAGLNAELNVLRWLRLNAGAGYRAVYGVDAKGFGNGDIGGPELQVTVKFGKF